MDWKVKRVCMHGANHYRVVQAGESVRYTSPVGSGASLIASWDTTVKENAVKLAGWLTDNNWWYRDVLPYATLNEIF